MTWYWHRTDIFMWNINFTFDRYKTPLSSILKSEWSCTKGIKFPPWFRSINLYQDQYQYLNRNKIPLWREGEDQVAECGSHLTACNIVLFQCFVVLRSVWEIYFYYLELVRLFSNGSHRNRTLDHSIATSWWSDCRSVLLWGCNTLKRRMSHSSLS